MKLTSYAGALGAKVTGIKLGLPLPVAERDELRAALNKHLVLIFPGQFLDAQALTAFGSQFGALNVHPFHQPIDGFPYVLEVAKQPDEHFNIGGYWHTDVTFLERPVMASVLSAQELPPVGGDTMFANLHLAYETLSPGMQAMLDGLGAIHSAQRGFGAEGLKKGFSAVSNRADDPRVSAEVHHPVVRTHPETGRKALFVNDYFTTRFVDMSEAESQPLLDYLCAWATRPEVTARVNWEPGMVVFFDNRCTQHYALNDYPGERRRLLRVAIEGDRPR